MNIPLPLLFVVLLVIFSVSATPCSLAFNCQTCLQNTSCGKELAFQTRKTSSSIPSFFLFKGWCASTSTCKVGAINGSQDGTCSNFNSSWAWGDTQNCVCINFVTCYNCTSIRGCGEITLIEFYKRNDLEHFDFFHMKNVGWCGDLNSCTSGNTTNSFYNCHQYVYFDCCTLHSDCPSCLGTTKLNQIY